MELRWFLLGLGVHFACRRLLTMSFCGAPVLIYPCGGARNRDETGDVKRRFHTGQLEIKLGPTFGPGTGRKGGFPLK